MFVMGAIYERLTNVRPYEADAVRGKATKQAAKLGGKNRAKLTETEKEIIRQEYAEKEGKFRGKRDICREIAEKYAVSYKTIERIVNAK